MMLAPSAEQQNIAESVADFLSSEVPMTTVRRLWNEERSVDDKTWRRSVEMGWFALSVPEEAGGVGLGLGEEVMLFREVGRFATPGPFRATALAAYLASRTGNTEVLAAILSGEQRVGLKVGDQALDAHPGDLLLELDDEHPRIYEIDTCTPLVPTDPGVRLARASVGKVVVEAAGVALLSRARVLAAAELLGVIEATRDMSASYAQVRRQFDKPIGSHQAVKHRCADMAVGAYAVTAQVFAAAVSVSEAHPDAAFHAAAAHVLASARARRATADNVQNHGGIGYTWEQDAHVYLKRALTLELSCGSRQAGYDALIAPERHEFR
ncbi:acyl-CoA dehydrogenase family protein [Nocardioides sp. WS12]|uniref:acyl-CoA dehydrogenase family protein n=1 Tax=Nocardioides sp. WS12 TaxID=2486272 RepID=UPI0015F7AB40|nr:acyl-CoA dehydrogenase family protein [Nocardioides sp. WS12]